MLQVRRTSARVAMGSALLALCLAVGGAQASSRDVAPAGSPESPGHKGFGTCGTTSILPVARFHSIHTDPLGTHYHGWIPPAGPPFFVECLRGELPAQGRP
jgi:hypothetical protein